ncbi:MAG: peptide-methionine (R)-S-oxide reductase MsrB [Bdellovibrionota bacterium]
MKKNDMIDRFWLVMLAVFLIFIGITPFKPYSLFAKDSKPMTKPPVDYRNQSDAYWKEKLTPGQYYILRKKGTERAFSGKYHDHHEHGIYRCAGCGLELFKSEQKFESGTGWPSFWAPIDPKNIEIKPDRSLFSTRIEVLCSRCGGHLGHVFDDGPAPTGKRFCMNSDAMVFEKK